ncbi:alpha-glucoside-specific PTS transporter subunit IIBC [Lactovum odontotermitis]
MEKIQRFGSAMFTPVLLFSFAGIMVAITVIFTTPTLVGGIADPGTGWYQFWKVIQNGAWSVFTQMNLLFVIGIPIGLAKYAQGRAAMESFVTYVTLNLFISQILGFWGKTFHVDFDQTPGAGTGLAEIASVKTLDTGILGAIVVAAIVVWLHNKFFNKKLPDWLGVFQGSSFVVIIGFFLMIPFAFLLCLIWPPIQGFIGSFQGFMKHSGYIGGFVFIFLERFLIPTGLHHFIYMPFTFGPASVPQGLVAYWAQHISQFADSTKPLKALFPEGQFMLQGNSKIFGALGISLALYKTALKENKKRVLALLIPATLTATLAGITEPLEFTFLFAAPILWPIHAFLAAAMGTTMYAFGVVGKMDNGIIEQLALDWIPMFPHHAGTVITQWVIGLVFSGIYFAVFSLIIKKLNLPTPGRELDKSGEDIQLHSKADYKEKKSREKSSKGADPYAGQARNYLASLGGTENIANVANCATRLRVTVLDEEKVKSDSDFMQGGAKGVIHVGGKVIHVVVGLDAPNVREAFEQLMDEESGNLITKN